MTTEKSTFTTTGPLDRIEHRADGTTWAIRYLPNGLSVETLLPYGVQPQGGYTADEIHGLRRVTS